MYQCTLSWIVIGENSANIVIGGTHLLGFDNFRVQVVKCQYSFFPSVITQVFAAFPNLFSHSVLAGGPTIIQPNSYTGAENLWVTSFRFSNLRELQANAFNGASRLSTVEILSTQLSTIHENAFAGLNVLRGLFLGQSQLKHLPSNVFRPLIAVDTMFLNGNQLQSLDGNLLSVNRQLRHLVLHDNQINAIERSFFDNLDSLFILGLIGNTCTNDHWLIGGDTTMETVRHNMTTCFDNFVETPEENGKKFVFELRGSLIIRNENGDELLRL